MKLVRTERLRKDAEAEGRGIVLRLEGSVRARVRARLGDCFLDWEAGAPRSGFSVLELMISSTVFLLVAGAAVTALVVSSALNMTNRETALASRAAQSIVEELKAVTFAEVFARYNTSDADDPAAGSSPGDDFAVAGLDLQSDDADGFVGSIEFPGTGATLREDGDDADLGLPRDLDGDGGVDANDHAGDYRILPVRIVVRWHGQNGARTFELVTVLTDY